MDDVKTDFIDEMDMLNNIVERLSFVCYFNQIFTENQDGPNPWRMNKEASEGLTQTLLSIKDDLKDTEGNLERLIKKILGTGD